MIARARPCIALAVLLAVFPAAFAQVPLSDDLQEPPTTLPFRPTVPSTPPARPTYPQQSEAPPPGDPLCFEIGRIIRAGVMASRFAGLSSATAGGAVAGTFEADEAITSLGGAYCTVIIPAAATETAGSAYNQVTCQLGIEHGETPYLDDFRERRAVLAERLSACPAMSRWTGEAPANAPLAEGEVAEDHIFSHPDVAVEILVRASHRKRTGAWPVDFMRTLSLVFRTPNPDRPEPEAGSEETGGALP